jgi:hypothetical protein
VSTTEVDDDINGGPPGELSVGPASSAIELENDIDGGAPGGIASECGSVHHRV